MSIISTKHLEGRVVLVTGASAGIGEAICRLFVQSGMKVVGAARRVEKIQDIACELKDQKGSLFPVKCDLSKDEEIYSLFETIKKRYGGVDICINNAGMTYANSLLDGNPKEWRMMMDINVIALCLCTKLTIASMKERGIDDGHILHISSMSSYKVMNEAAGHFYSSTKFAVKSLTEGLRKELRTAKSKIRVSSISPGLVNTEIILKATNDAKVANQMSSSIPMLQAQDIASTVLHIIASPLRVEINDILITPTGAIEF